MLALTATAVHGCAYPEIAPSPRAALQPTSQAKHPPTCNAVIEARNFQKESKLKLEWFDRLSGFITTPFKHFSTSFDGPAAWRDTGCDAWGIGTPVCPTQHSTDGLYTIDVALRAAWVDGVKVEDGSYVRLEVLPGRPAHDALRKRKPQPTDIIWFIGPLIWDKDKRPPKFAFGHMEIHPREPIQFIGTKASPIECPPKPRPPSSRRPT